MLSGRGRVVCLPLRPLPRKNGPDRRAYQREYHARNRERAWERNLKSKYGITSEDYYRMLDEQGGRCAICGAEADPYGRSKFSVDHDHKTGEVRGLLCTHCNRAIGMFADSAELLVRAADYLGGTCSTSSSS